MYFKRKIGNLKIELVKKTFLRRITVQTVYIITLKINKYHNKKNKTIFLEEHIYHKKKKPKLFI